jgi:hypothetical protein
VLWAAMLLALAALTAVAIRGLKQAA